MQVLSKKFKACGKLFDCMLVWLYMYSELENKERII